MLSSPIIKPDYKAHVVGSQRPKEISQGARIVQSPDRLNCDCSRSFLWDIPVRHEWKQDFDLMLRAQIPVAGRCREKFLCCRVESCSVVEAVCILVPAIRMSREHTKNMQVIRARPGHEVMLANYFAMNECHFQRWSPTLPADHHSIDSWKIRLDERELEFNKGVSVHVIGIDETESFVVGGCSLSNIVRGVFQSCHMGYSIAQRFEGEGKMKQIVTHVIEFAFQELKWHRIMANHMPANQRSAGLLKSLGFEKEGYAKEYLLINGEWEDHILNSLINKAYPG